MPDWPSLDSALAVAVAVVDLLLTFLLVGALAFGGGQAALPLVERLAVGVNGWLTPTQFATAVGLSYATPGPVLIIAAYIGYVTAGVGGAAVAVFGVFAVPVLAATGAASAVQRLSGTWWLAAFGRTAGAAAIGLLVVTLVSLARPLFDAQAALLTAPLLVAVAARRVHPLVLLTAAAATGAVLLPAAGIT